MAARTVMMKPVIQNDALVVIEFAGQPLALTREEFAQALERGREFTPAQSTTEEEAQTGRLLTAEQMQDVTGVPASWWGESARRGDVPHRRFGKYVRFALAEVLLCPAFKNRSE